MQHKIQYVIKYSAKALQSAFTNLTPDLCKACFSTIIQLNLPKTERDRSGIFFPFSQVSVLQRVVF